MCKFAASQYPCKLSNAFVFIIGLVTATPASERCSCNTTWLDISKVASTKARFRAKRITKGGGSETSDELNSSGYNDFTCFRSPDHNI